MRPVSCFTGRTADDGAIGERLTPEQAAVPGLVIVTDAPGIGKAALALHTAHRIRESFPGGRLVLPMVRNDGRTVTADEARAALDAADAADATAGRTLDVFDDVARRRPGTPGATPPRPAAP